MELWRRIALMAGLASGLWLWFQAAPEPLVTVELFDAPAEQEALKSFFGYRSEEQRRLAALSPEAFAEETVRGRRVEAEGEAWTAFFDRMRQACAAPKVPAEWRERVAPGERLPASGRRRIYLRPGEGPLSGVAAALRETGVLYVAPKDRPGDGMLKLGWKAYSADDFHFGSGFAASPRPPTALLFPYRSWARAAWLAGILLYLALPRRRVRPGDLAYPLWRIRLGDFLGALLFALFFGLPLLIAGSSGTLLSAGWALVPVFWTLASGGVLILLLSVRWADWRIRVEPDGLCLPGPSALRLYPFAGMAFFQPVELRPPKWMVFLSRAAAIGGSNRAGAAGRATLLDGTVYHALGIGLKGGGMVYLWLTDQAGSWLVPGLERVFEALDSAGVPRKEEPLTLERITLPASSPPP